MIISKLRYFDSAQKNKILKILDCAKDLRKNFSCDILAREYLEDKSYAKIVSSWEIDTLPQEWENYPEDKSIMFEKYPKKILEYAIHGWRSYDEKIGSLESLIQNEHIASRPRIFIREENQDFTFCSNQTARDIYQRALQDKYKKKDGSLNATQIAKNYNEETGENFTYREIVVIYNKYKNLNKK